ncbi:MAG TPA: ABC transporter substrate-binding protein [Candidatus Binatia bacterium]|nr:ABC transporter substrate-binding protein [Candidatus Binatia bacterium]
MKKAAVPTILVAVILLAVAVTTEAQQLKKIAKIGYLLPSTPAAAAHLLEAFRQGLRELGYVEGKTLVLELRYGEAKTERLPELARELVGLKVDVIVTATDVAIAAVKRETQTIPIVMGNSSDPVGTGFVASLARPGGNITGLTSISPELSGKRLELLREVVPGLSRVAFIWNPDVRGAVLDYKETEGAASSLHMQLQSVEVSRAEDFDRAFSAITKARAQALMMPAANPVGFANRSQIASFAQKNRLPSMYAQKEYVDAGGLMSYGPSTPDMHRHAATYVDKILKGTKPADLPVEQPRKFELVISLKTAKQIGLTIPPNVLARADQVIK